MNRRHAPCIIRAVSAFTVSIPPLSQEELHVGEFLKPTCLWQARDLQRLARGERSKAQQLLKDAYDDVLNSAQVPPRTMYLIWGFTRFVSAEC